MSVLTKTQLVSAVPNLKGADTFLPILNTTLEKYGITAPLEVAAFVATCGHESSDFSTFSENLNYSSDALLRVFHKYFTPALADQYARNAKAIGSRVYANRMGNGDEKSGDGYIFRGAGAIQLTGRYTIGKFAFAVGMPIDQANAYLRTTTGALEGAGWYWKTNNLHQYVNDFQALSAVVNVGRASATPDQIVGWPDRIARFMRARKAIS